MNDIDIIIKDFFGRDMCVNTEQIDEDVLRMRMGLQSQKQDDK